MVTWWPSLHLGHPPPYPLSLSLSFSLPPFFSFLPSFFVFLLFIFSLFPFFFPPFIPPSLLSFLPSFHTVEFYGPISATREPQHPSQRWQISNKNPANGFQWSVIAVVNSGCGHLESQDRACVRNPVKSILSSQIPREWLLASWVILDLSLSLLLFSLFHHLPVLHLFQEGWARRYK